MLYAPEGFGAGDQRASSGGTPLLFPFPGRIEGASFQYEGKSYQLPPGDSLGNAIHGFVFNRPWRVVEQSEASVTGEFVGSLDAPETLANWPSDYRIQATYRIEPGRLVLDVECSNPGDAVLPYGFGTHAYFRLPLAGAGDPEETLVQAPVDHQWEFVDMIATGVREPTAAAEGLAAGAPLAGQQFDSGFRLDPAASGDVVSSLEANGVRLTQTCSDAFKCYVVYTPGNRQAVCIEPYTCVPSPFGMAERGADTGLRVLAPGESDQFTLTLAVESTS